MITAKDHASIQLQVADVDSEGKAIKGQATTIAICGKIRAQGDSDDSINRIATKEGRKSDPNLLASGDVAKREDSKLMICLVLKNVWSYSR